jgi:hypothetical protein
MEPRAVRHNTEPVRQIKDLDDLRAVLNEMMRTSAEYTRRLDRMVEILLGDIYEKHPDSVEEFLRKHGYSADRISQMDPVERHEAWREVWKTLPGRTETLTTALDLLFGIRYGWQEGTAKKLTPVEAFLALEHAIEYDAPGKPSIWDATR